MAEIKKVIPEPPKEKERHGSGAVWAMFLIFIGVIFLLNNLGVLPWTVWGVLWRFWPLLLVLWGVQLILGGSWFSGITIAIVSFILFLAVMLLALTSAVPTMHDYFSTHMSWFSRFSTTLTDYGEKTKQIRVEEPDYAGTKERDVTVSIGAATFTLVDDSSTSDFFKVDAIYSGRYGEPRVASSLKDGKLSINLSNDTDFGFHMFWFGDRSYDFTLGKPEVPTILAMKMGAGTGTINLDELKEKKITLDLGAGKLTVTLGKNSIPAEGIKLEVGAGSVTVNLPEGVGFKATYDVGIGDLKVDGAAITSGFAADGTYTSENYAGAETKLEIEVSVGAGSVNIQTQ